jgi:hypothetical protein
MGFLQIHRAGHLSFDVRVVSNGGRDLGVPFRFQGGERLRVRSALIYIVDDSWRRPHFSSDSYRFRLPHGRKRGLDFRSSCDGSGPFVPARRAVDDGDDSLRRATGGGHASASDGNAFPSAADGDVLDRHFATTPAGRDATVNCSYATAERDAAEFFVK